MRCPCCLPLVAALLLLSAAGPRALAQTPLVPTAPETPPQGAALAAVPAAAGEFIATICNGGDGQRWSFAALPDGVWQPQAQRRLGFLAEGAPGAAEGTPLALRFLPQGAPVLLTVGNLRPEESARGLQGLRIFADDGERQPPRLIRPFSAAAGGDGELRIRARLDDEFHWWPWRTHRIYVVACPEKGTELVYFGLAEIYVSNRIVCIALTLAAVGLFYAAAVHALRGHAAGLNRWDPVVLTAGQDGHGSISKLQILFFTMIVAGLLVYVLLRVGRLGDLSEDILLLLGIAGAGTAAANATSLLRRRLSPHNLAWLRRHGWLPEQKRPRWADLVMEAGEFDIYRFQILVFSLVVGLSLLFTGLFGLADFDLPDGLLALLGLSQVVYVGGKIISNPAISELDAQIDKLRKAAGDFASAASVWDGAGHRFDYARAPGWDAILPQAQDVVRLTESVFGGRAPQLAGKLPHELR